jgi:hypothetical protein
VGVKPFFTGPTMVLKLQARGVISSWVADFLKFMKLYKLLGLTQKRKKTLNQHPKFKRENM